MYLNESSLWEAIVKKNDTSEDFVWTSHYTDEKHKYNENTSVDEIFERRVSKLCTSSIAHCNLHSLYLCKNVSYECSEKCIRIMNEKDKGKLLPKKNLHLKFPSLAEIFEKEKYMH